MNALELELFASGSTSAEVREAAAPSGPRGWDLAEQGRAGECGLPGQAGQGLPTAVGSEQTQRSQICLRADLLLLKCEGHPGVGKADEKREGSEASDVT